MFLAWIVPPFSIKDTIVLLAECFYKVRIRLLSLLLMQLKKERLSSMVYSKSKGRTVSDHTTYCFDGLQCAA